MCYYSQKFRGLFHGSLVIQTLAAHFNAIDGSKWIHGLYEGDTPPTANSALALAVAAVSCLYLLDCTLLNHKPV